MNYLKNPLDDILFIASITCEGAQGLLGVMTEYGISELKLTNVKARVIGSRK